MFVVVAYDIVDDRRRQRVAKILEGYGERVNLSVFECELKERQFEGLQKKVNQLIDREEDRVRYYELCLDCRRRILVNGEVVPLEPQPLVFV